MSTLDEILQFEVYKADAKLDRDSMHVRLVYPKNPKKINTIIPEHLEFGRSVLNELRNYGYCDIASQGSPIKPPSAGSVYITLDGKLIIHRRDTGARTNALYHSIYAGFTASTDFVYSEEGLINTALRETAEESLIITNEDNPTLLIPSDSEQVTQESANRLGLNLKSRLIPVKTLPAKDTLEVLGEDGKRIYKANVWLELYHSGHSGISAILLRQLPFNSEEILPIDAEGMTKDGKFIHFNRESYIVDPKDIPRNFGEPLENTPSYQTQFAQDGKPKIYGVDVQPPFFGPEKVRVTHPHIFAPDDLLAKVLSVLDIPGYESNRWIETELHKINSRLESKSPVPEQFIIKG